MKKNPNDEPKVWVTVVKLVIGLVLIVGGVGLALWYAKDMDNGAAPIPAGDAWGISKDSPLRMKR
jgi:multisubunit Na+/H+ antiporter MnhC subunit